MSSSTQVSETQTVSLHSSWIDSSYTSSVTVDVPPGVSFSDPSKENHPTDSLTSHIPFSSSKFESFSAEVTMSTTSVSAMSTTSVSATVTVTSFLSFTETYNSNFATESTEGHPTTEIRLATISTQTTSIESTIPIATGNTESNVDIYHHDSVFPKATTVTRPYGTGHATKSVTLSSMRTHSTSSLESDLQVESFSASASGISQYSGSSSAHNFPSPPALVNDATIRSNTLFSSFLAFGWLFIITV